MSVGNCEYTHNGQPLTDSLEEDLMLQEDALIIATRNFLGEQKVKVIGKLHENILGGISSICINVHLSLRTVFHSLVIVVTEWNPPLNIE